MFRQLVQKIANFVDIRRNNCAFTKKKKKIVCFKTISREKSRILLIFDELVTYLRKTIEVLKNVNLKKKRKRKKINN